VHAGQHPAGGSSVTPAGSAHTRHAPSDINTGGAPAGRDSRDDGRDKDVGRHTGEGKGKGAEISTLARTTDATGAAKGAEISTAASGGTSQAGQHGHQGHDSPPPPQADSHSPNQHSHQGDPPGHAG
jgi:hypothetical protein